MIFSSSLTKLPHKYFLLFAGVLLYLCIATFIHTPKVFADCGVTIPGVNQFQGAVIVMDWQHGDGSGTTQSNNTQVHVWSSGVTGAPPYNNEVHLDSSHGEIGSVASNGSGNGGTFSQVGTGWAGSGGCNGGQSQGHSSAVVLGYGNTSPCVSGCGGLNGAYNWALRCGTLEGNEQQFHYDGVGVPSGARSVNNKGQRGYWMNQVGPFGNNGSSDIEKLVYIEPPPNGGGKPPPPSATLTCSTVDVNSPDSASQPHDEYQVTVTDSSGPGGPPIDTLINASVIHAAHPVNTQSFSFTPHWQYVNLTVVDAHHDPVTGTWSYSTINTQSAGPCYSAECSLTIDTNIPGGYVLAGQPYTVTATLYNDSPSGLDLPGNTGNASQYLEIQSNGGSFGFLSPPTNAVGIGASTQVSFTMTFGSGGTLQGQAAYNGAYFLGAAPGDPGYSCSTPVNIYPPPIINTDGVSCAAASIFGWAFDPLASDSSIPVDVYADGPAGTGAYLGRFPADQPRPDVDAAYGIGGNHGFNIPFPAAYQDGQNHTFYSYAIDPYGIENSGPSTVGMTGCEAFHITPGANGAYLLHKFPDGTVQATYEDPNNFGSTANDTSITVTYNGNSFYGPNPGFSPGFPGVPIGSAVPPGFATYTYTKNGVVVGGGAIPSPTGTGRFLDQNWAAPLLPVSSLLAGDKYCLSVGVSPSDGFIQNDGTILSNSTNPNPDNSPPSCDTVQNRPFFKAYGSGVSAGGAFNPSGTSSCSTVGGELASWNNDSGTNPIPGGGGPDYGASSQFSALSLTDIVGFASAQTAFGRSPTDLSFANSGAGVNVSTDAYSPYLGGKFANTQCLTDVVKPTGGDTTNVAGNLILGLGGTVVNPISPGDNKSIFVTGNVYIKNNITYGSGWTMNNVPSFVLSATGNIYIDPSVTELDGLYIAKPNSGGAGGEIYTCYPGLGPVTAAYISNLFNEGCNNQLAVYGRFEANKVNMMRTYGSIRDETPNPAVTTGGSPGVTAPLKWSFAGTIPGDTCTRIIEPSEPNLWNYTGPPHSNNGWIDNYLCVPPGDTGPSGPVQLSWTCDNFAVGSTNNCDTGSNSAPTSDCTGSIGNIINNPPWNYPAGYTWTDNEVCSNYPIVFVADHSGPKDSDFPSGQHASDYYCTVMNEPWDTDGNAGGIWQGNAYICIQKGTLGTTTPPTANVVIPCSNSGLRSSPRTTCAAEVFDFDPQLYLASPNVGQPSGGATQYKAETGLPPVL